MFIIDKNLMPTVVTPEALAAQLARHSVLNAETGCIEWTGCLTRNGYGLMTYKRRGGVAHRFAYEGAIGPIPDGLVIDHLCRNRRCINPAHLEVVTQAENTRRGQSPHVVAGLKGECTKGHDVSGDNRVMKGKTPRCKICLQVYTTAKYLERKAAGYYEDRKPHRRALDRALARAREYARAKS